MKIWKLKSKFGNVRDFQIVYSNKRFYVVRFRDKDGYWRYKCYDALKDEVLRW